MSDLFINNVKKIILKHLEDEDFNVGKLALEIGLGRSQVLRKVKINFKKMEATVSDVGIKLTRKEFDILEYLIKHEGEVVHRHDLLNEVWGYDKIPTTRTVDNFILDIRKKIEKEPSNPLFIKTISGVGYKFKSKK